MNLEQLSDYAPYIVIVIAFLSTYKIFVTPKDLEDKLKDYVLKETYSVAINEIKTDIDEIKSKLDRIYEKLIKK